MKSNESKSKYSDFYEFLIEKMKLEVDYEELLTKTHTNDYLSFILNIKKSDIKGKKYDSQFDFADENTPVEIFKILNEKYHPLRIYVMYLVHLTNNVTKNEFSLPEELSEKEKQALKNLIFLYSTSCKKFEEIDVNRFSKKLSKHKNLNFFDFIKQYYNEFEEANREAMVVFDDYNDFREKNYSDREILKAFTHYLDSCITNDELHKFKSRFKDLVFEVKDLTSKGFFGENPVNNYEEFYCQKAINILSEFIECLNIDTTFASYKRGMRKEIEFLGNFVNTASAFIDKFDYSHLPIIDQILFIAPIAVLIKNYNDFYEDSFEDEGDRFMITKTGPVPKNHQFIFIQTFYNLLLPFEFNEKTKHKLIRILNLLSSLTSLLGEKFDEISSYDIENIDKILRKSI